MTTVTTTVTNETVSVPSNVLSDGAIVGIVAGAIAAIVLLLSLAFIIYKYRKRFVNILHKNSKQSTDHSVQYKIDKPSPNINFAPPNEYLTVNTSLSTIR